MSALQYNNIKELDELLREAYDIAMSDIYSGSVRVEAMKAYAQLLAVKEDR